MPEVDIVDDTWFGVAPQVLAPYVADPANWRRWWPDLDSAGRRMARGEGRALDGARRCRRALAGSMEVWLQDVDDGTVAHFFLRLDGVRRRLRRRERARTSATPRRDEGGLLGPGRSPGPGPARPTGRAADTNSLAGEIAPAVA